MGQIKNTNQNCEKHSLTHPQKRIWYTEKIYNGTSIHNIGGVIQIMGEIDLPILEKSIQHIIKTNESLRLQVFEENGQVFQTIMPYTEMQIETVHFLDCENPENAFHAWVQTEAEKPFLFSQRPLYHFALFEVNQKHKGCLIKLHHIIADGWSMEIITNQIMQNYQAYKDEGKVADSGLYTYSEYLDKESEYKKSPAWKQDREFWAETFKSLPYSTVFERETDIHGERKVYIYSTVLSQKIKSFAKEHSVSVNAFFITCYLLFLYKHDGEQDITIGLPVTNRINTAQKRTIGMYTSSVPFRFRVNPMKTGFNMLRDVMSTLFICYKHQRYPYDLIIHDLISDGHTGLVSLYSSSLNFFNNRLIKEVGGYKTVNTQFYPGCQINSLNMNVKDWADDEKFTIEFEYHKAKYDKDDIFQIYEFMRTLAEQMIENPWQIIRKLDGLTEAYKEKVQYFFNDTQSKYPDNQTIHALFEKQVELYSQRTAVRDGDIVITYNQLNRCADQLACTLIQSGVKYLDYVGIVASHSIQTIIAILAVLKIGAAYVPIDTEYPNARVNYILEDADVVVLLADEKSINNVNPALCPVIYIGNCDQVGTTEMASLCSPARYCDPAYVIYTSGSTGHPKGVVVVHKSLVNYIVWAIKNYKVTPDDRFPLYSSLAFDLTITSIFAPLIAGGEIIIYNTEKEYSLFSILQENKATIMKLTPSHLELIKDIDNSRSNITRLIVGGENLTVTLASRIHDSFGGRAKIFNEYGPTEATVGCMTYLFDPSVDKGVSVPIGVPADNVQIYILNHDQNFIQAGQIGEMYISGDGVAREYLRKPQLTAERFFDCMFTKNNRMFKTGDLAKFNSEGQIEFCGRNDSQVKIQGYRIELNEIENALIQYEGIRQAVVFADRTPNNSQFLKAYFVAQQVVDISEVRKYLADHIPIYMIPRQLYQVQVIPLTPNGKADLDALKQFSEDNNARLSNTGEHDDAALNVLIQVLQEILNLKTISSDDNFYHIGGDSISAIRISAKLEHHGYLLSVQNILLHPVINEMLEKIETKIATQKPKEVPDVTVKDIQPTPILQWFFEQKLQEIGHYNQSILLKFDKEVPSEAIKDIIFSAVEKHKTFAMNLNIDNQTFFYGNQKLDILDYYDISNNVIQEEAINTIIQNFNMQFNISEDFLMKGAIFYTGAETYVFLTAHHISVDLVSWLVLLEEILELAINLISGKNMALSTSKDFAYTQWSNIIRENSLLSFEEELPYWRNVLDGQILYQRFFAVSNDTQNELVYYRTQIDKSSFTVLFNDLDRNKSLMETIFVSAFAMSLCAHTNQDKAYFMLESHGRLLNSDLIDFSKSVGWFTALHPFSLQMKNEDLSQFIIQTQQKLQDIPNNGIGYGVLKYIHHQFETQKSEQLVFFNYLGDFSLEKGPVSLIRYGFPGDISKSNKLGSLFDFNIMIIKEKIDIMICYDKSVVDVNKIEAFCTRFKNALSDISASALPKMQKAAGSVDYSILDEQEIELLFE